MEGARNILKGAIVEISTGGVTSRVRLDVGGNVVTSSITNEAPYPAIKFQRPEWQMLGHYIQLNEIHP